MTTNEERDSAGRHPGAPAWDGDLSTVSPAGLEAHDKGLQSCIANLTVQYHVLDGWRVRTPEERSVDGFEKWVDRLAVVRNERRRRENRTGLSEYQGLFGTSAFEEPWSSYTS